MAKARKCQTISQRKYNRGQVWAPREETYSTWADWDKGYKGQFYGQQAVVDLDRKILP